MRHIRAAVYANSATAAHSTCSRAKSGTMLLQMELKGLGSLADFHYDESSNFRLAAASATSPLELGAFYVNLSGNIPCCLDNATVPQGGPAATNVTLGSVLGVCNLLSKRAEITWLGSVYPQDIANARLLTMTISSRPGGSLRMSSVWQAHYAN